MTAPILTTAAAVARFGALPMPAGPVRPIADLDVPLADVEHQLATHTTTAEEAQQ